MRERLQYAKSHIAGYMQSAICGGKAPLGAQLTLVMGCAVALVGAVPACASHFGEMIDTAHCFWKNATRFLEHALQR